MNDSKPLILVSNDDGIVSKGISALIKFIRPLGEIVIVAPDSPRSGTSGALTVKEPIHYELVRQDVGLIAYRCSGTPVDCIKLAFDKICERKPDLVLAGINHGDNSATNTYNSGTMGAIRESCLAGIKSIAFSLCNHNPDADFEPSGCYIRSIVEWALQNDFPNLTCLNVNFPDVPAYNGIRVCKMSTGHWENEFEVCSKQGDDHYFWLVGDFVDDDPDNETTDHWALTHNYIAVTPTKLDVTDYEHMGELQKKLNSL